MFVRNLLLVLLLIVAPVSPFADEAETRVLIFGGTGQMGSDIARALVSAGHTVTIFVRETSSRARLEGLAVDFVVGDVLNRRTVDRALLDGDFDVLVDALGRGSASVDFYRSSAVNIAASAAAHQVGQIILHGSVGAGDSRTILANGDPRPLSPLMAAKTDGEQAVMQSGVTYTIIRNYRLLPFGTPDNGEAKLYADQTVRGPVTRAALARLTADCILSTRCADTIFHAADLSRVGARSDD